MHSIKLRSYNCKQKLNAKFCTVLQDWDHSVAVLKLRQSDDRLNRDIAACHKIVHCRR